MTLLCLVLLCLSPPHWPRQSPALRRYHCPVFCPAIRHLPVPHRPVLRHLAVSRLVFRRWTVRRQSSLRLWSHPALRPQLHRAYFLILHLLLHLVLCSPPHPVLRLLYYLVLRLPPHPVLGLLHHLVVQLTLHLSAQQVLRLPRQFVALLVLHLSLHPVPGTQLHLILRLPRRLVIRLMLRLSLHLVPRLIVCSSLHLTLRRVLRLVLHRTPQFCSVWGSVRCCFRRFIWEAVWRHI